MVFVWCRPAPSAPHSHRRVPDPLTTSSARRRRSLAPLHRTAETTTNHDRPSGATPPTQLTGSNNWLIRLHLYELNAHSVGTYT